MSSLFKSHKRKEKVVTIQGEDFTLVEPSALAMCDYYEVMEKEHGLINDGSSIYFKAAINHKVGFRLVAACLVNHFKDTSVNAIYRMLCDEITTMPDGTALIEGAEEVAGIVFQEIEAEGEGEPVKKLEKTELQGGSLATD